MVEPGRADEIVSRLSSASSDELRGAAASMAVEMVLALEPSVEELDAARELLIERHERAAATQKGVEASQTAVHPFAEGVRLAIVRDLVRKLSVLAAARARLVDDGSEHRARRWKSPQDPEVGGFPVLRAHWVCPVQAAGRGVS